MYNIITINELLEICDNKRGVIEKSLNSNKSIIAINNKRKYVSAEISDRHIEILKNILNSDIHLYEIDMSDNIEYNLCSDKDIENKIDIVLADILNKSEDSIVAITPPVEPVTHAIHDNILFFYNRKQISFFNETRRTDDGRSTLSICNISEDEEFSIRADIENYILFGNNQDLDAFIKNAEKDRYLCIT